MGESHHRLTWLTRIRPCWMGMLIALILIVWLVVLTWSEDYVAEEAKWSFNTALGAPVALEITKTHYHRTGSRSWDLTVHWGWFILELADIYLISMLMGNAMRSGAGTATVSSVARLAVSPGSLASVAAECSLGRAACAGWAAVAIVLAVPFAADIATFDGRFEGFADFLMEAIRVLPFVAGVSVLLVGAGVLALVILLGALFLPVRRERDRRIQQIILLSPMTLVLPGLLWAGFAVVEACSRIGIVWFNGRPSWLDSGLVRVLGDATWILAAIPLLMFFCILAFRRIPQYLETGYPRCKQCRYNLTGNVSGICPECGTPCTDVL